ncbi:MAG: MFS transporter [Woeseiaceae bacterium]
MKRHLPSLVAIISATAVFSLSNGILTSLIPIRMGLAEDSGFATSLVATAFTIGFLFGCLRVVRIIRAVGHIRAFAAFAGATAVTTLMLEATAEPIFWFVLRLVQGACLAGLFTVADSWINDKTPNNIRGQILSIYFIIITIALVGGQLLLYFFDATSVALVMIVSGLFSLALIPVCLTTTTSPKTPDVVTVSPRRLYQQAPSAVVGCFVVGAMGAAILNMAPFYLASVAVPSAEIGLFIGAIHITRLVLQWPVGLVSDRMDRRIVIVASSILIVILAVVIILIAPGGGRVYHDPSYQSLRLPLYALFGVLGAFSVMLYSVCIAHAHDRVPPEETAATTSTMLLVWSVGAMVGLLVLGVLMDIGGVFALFWFTGGSAAVLAAHTLWYMRSRAAPKERREFVTVPTTSPLVSEFETEQDQKGL